MKRFRFSQQRLLDIRRQQLRVAEARVHVVRAKHEAAVAAIRTIEQRIDSHATQFDRVCHDVMLHHQAAVALQDQFRDTTDVLAELDRELQQQIRSALDRRRDAEALEVLSTQEREEHSKLEQRHLQNELEYLVLSHWGDASGHRTETL